jgi:hypothetical protein
MIIEKEIHNLIATSLTDIDVYYGKIDDDVNWDTTTTISIFTLPCLTSKSSPSYLERLQLSVRGKYIDKVQETVNRVIILLQHFSGLVGDKRIWVIDVSPMGILYEDEDLVHSPIEITIKYSGNL